MTEAEVLAAVLRLAHGRTDLVLWRNTVGHATEYDAGGRARHITYGLGPGSPDVVGVLTVEGLAVWVAIECKAPRGRVAPEQAQWLAAAERRGIACGVARSAEEAAEIIAAGAERVRRILDVGGTPVVPSPHDASTHDRPRRHRPGPPGR
jgi:hypothetical protein